MEPLIAQVSYPNLARTDIRSRPDLNVPEFGDGLLLFATLLLLAIMMRFAIPSRTERLAARFNWDELEQLALKFSHRPPKDSTPT